MLNIKRTAALLTAAVCMLCAGCSKSDTDTQKETSVSTGNSSSKTDRVELKDYSFPEFLSNIKNPDMLSRKLYSSFDETVYEKEITEQPFSNLTCQTCIDDSFYTFVSGNYMGLLNADGDVVIESEKYVSIKAAAPGLLRLSYNPELKAADAFARYDESGNVVILDNYSFDPEYIEVLDEKSDDGVTHQYFQMSDGVKVTDSSGNYLWDSIEPVDMENLVTTKVYSAYYKATRSDAVYYICFDSVYNYTVYEGAYAFVKLKVGNVTGQCYVLNYDDYSELNKMVESFGRNSSGTNPSRDETIDYIQLTFGLNTPDQIMMTVSSDGFCLTDNLTHNNQPDNKFFTRLDKDSYVSLVLWVDQVLSQEYKTAD